MLMRLPRMIHEFTFSLSRIHQGVVAEAMDGSGVGAADTGTWKEWNEECATLCRRLRLQGALLAVKLWVYGFLIIRSLVRLRRPYIQPPEVPPII